MQRFVTSAKARKPLVDTRVVTRESQRIGVLRLANGEQNTLVTALRRDLLSGLKQCEQQGCKAVVITGSQKVFSSGMDPAAFRRGDWNTSPNLSDVIVAIAKSPLPTIASLDGLVSGGGLEIALACNFRVGDRKTQLAMSETTKFGLLPGAQGTQRLPRLIGVRKSLEMMLGGLPIKGTEAKEIGLLSHLVPADVEEDVYESSLMLADSLQVGNTIPSTDQLPNAQNISKDDIEEICSRFPHLSKETKQAVCDAVKGSTVLPFNKGVQLEMFLFRELITANQRNGIIQFEEVVRA